MYMIELAHAAETIQIKTGAWHAIASANIIVQLSLLILAIMTIGTWAIIISKKNQLESFKEDNETFLNDFWKANSLDDVYAQIDSYKSCPLAHVFRAGYLELRKIADSNLASTSKDSATPLLTGIDNLERALKQATDSELALMEKRLSFLATTGSSGPFIGLFGTVVGIMSAFQKIAETGSASLAVVAPGISEALIATAVGLFAAIPASVGYNYYISKLSKQELALSNFTSDFLNIAKRNFFKES